MNSLVIDTSIRNQAACLLVSQQQIVDGQSFFNTAACEALAFQLRQFDYETIEAIIVVKGPGSYTGIRAGMASAMGVAQALAKPLYGLTSLEIAVATVPPEIKRVRAVVDAGRKSVYTVQFEYEMEQQRWLMVEHPRRMSLADLALEFNRQDGLVGFAGLSQFSEFDLDCSGDWLISLARASQLALQDVPLSFDELEPIYLDE